MRLLTQKVYNKKENCRYCHLYCKTFIPQYSRIYSEISQRTLAYSLTINYNYLPFIQEQATHKNPFYQLDKSRIWINTTFTLNNCIFI